MSSLPPPTAVDPVILPAEKQFLAPHTQLLILHEKRFMMPHPYPEV